MENVIKISLYGGRETHMARHMMQRDMLHNDMAENHAAVSYYAGSSSFWGFYWYAYFTKRYRKPADKC